MKLTMGFAITFALGLTRVVFATTMVVRPGQSIQATVDSAAPGTTIVVLPGTYHEAGWPHAVSVTKDGIRLIGRPRRGRPVVLEQAASQVNGLWVSPADSLHPTDAELPPCGGPSGKRINGFQISGFTLQGFPGYGIYLACVDGFTIRRNVAVADRTYSIFPIRSTQGRVTRNSASGSFTEACIYVGESDHVTLDHNEATDCQIGLQIENTTQVTVRRNRLTGNTAGMIVDVISAHQLAVASDNTVVDNVIADNNRPNSGGESDTAAIQPGIGVIINGADRTLLARNLIERHQLAGLALLTYCIGAPQDCANPNLAINPYPDGNRVVANRFVANAVNVIFAPDKGQGNCFAHNRPDPLIPNGTLPACQ